MRVVIILLAVYTPSLSGVMFAQQPVGFYPGSQFRIFAPGCRLEGQKVTIEAFHGDFIILPTDPRRSSNPNPKCPISSVTRLEVRRDRKGQALAGAIIGFWGGVAVGGLVGYSTCAPCDEEMDTLAPFVLSIVGGSVGIITGVIVGLQPSWEEVPTERIRFSLTPQRYGLSAGVSVAF